MDSVFFFFLNQTINENVRKLTSYANIFYFNFYW